jgi:hypothetical protein
VAVLVVLCTVGGVERDDDTVDLQCRLIQARDAHEAYQLAMNLGPAQNHSYQNSDGEIVRWEFKGLHRLERLNDQELAHCTEVYSSLVRTPFRDLIVTKDELLEFWLEKNKDRRVGELLEESNIDDKMPKTDKPSLH